MSLFFIYQHATAKVDHQINILLQYISALVQNLAGHDGDMMDATDATSHVALPTGTCTNLPQTTSRSDDFMSTINSIKNDIVHTLKKVVDIIGQYAAAYLPFEARRRVKGFILALPSRWASINAESAGEALGTNTPHAEASKVLSLATESSNMLKSVTVVFSQSVDGAEKMLGRSSAADEPMGGCFR